MSNKSYFYQFETVDLLITLKTEGGGSAAEVLEDYDEIIVSLEQPPALVNVANFDVRAEESAIVAHLSQQETGSINTGTATIQVNVYKNRRRKATGYGQILVKRNLHKQIMGGE